MRKTIAIISHEAFPLVNFRGPLIADLVRNNARVIALAPDIDGASGDQLRALGAEPLVFSLARNGMNPFRDLLDTLRLALLLRHLKPDVTLGFFVKPVIFGTLASWIVRTPHRVALIEGLGYFFTDGNQRRSLRDVLVKSTVTLLYRFALSKAHRVIFLNRDDINEFVSRSLVAAEKATCLGGIGVDLNRWAWARPCLQPVTFLLVARLLRDKGIAEFVEAARLVKAKHESVRFVLLGGLDTNPAALRREEVEGWVNEGLLEWPGHVNVEPWLAQASVFVLPSYREGVPRSTQEAMAMGRAVITTDVPGCRETVQDGLNGFLVPARNATALAEAMLKIVSNPNLIGTMGNESRRLAVEHFDVEKVNTRLIGMLMPNELAGGR